MKKFPVSRYLELARYASENMVEGEAIYPFYASFKVTHKCSLRCSFCNVWMEDTKDLSKKKVFEIIDKIADSSIAVLSLEGGDPLMRKDIGDILRYAHSKPFVLFLTTNGHLLDKRPMDEYGKYLDYLHISIDEGHENLEFFDRLEEFQSYGPDLCVQIVVTMDTLDKVESKVKRVYEADARTVVMPACHLSGTEDFYPDPEEFRAELLRLKSKYKNTITTPKGFLDNINKDHGCSTSSIIIDSDGGLFYPCRTMGERLFNFTDGDFMEFLKSEEAEKARRDMKKCDKRCGWYQYFATDSFVSPFSMISSLNSYLLKK